MSEVITFPANGRTAEGYLALPPSGRGPGLLVIQEWWGLVDHIKDLADRFAREGFVSLAPDLYHGEQTKSPDQAGKLLMALNIADTAKDLRGAAVYLRGRAEVQPKKVAAVGFCMGGQLALFGATAHPDVIDATVDFYGIHPKVNPDVSRLSGPVLAHFGRRDKSVNESTAKALVDRITAAGKSVEAYFYDAEHAFFNDQRREVYHRASAELAWSRTVEFLRRVLA
ncbi:MAG: dienelactone hydrolase family protein [Gemmatimonadaceae bacterium]